MRTLSSEVQNDFKNHLVTVLRSCTKAERLYVIRRELDLLCYRADYLPAGVRRDLLIERIARLNRAYLLAL